MAKKSIGKRIYEAVMNPKEGETATVGSAAKTLREASGKASSVVDDIMNPKSSKATSSDEGHSWQAVPSATTLVITRNMLNQGQKMQQDANNATLTQVLFLNTGLTG